MKTSLLCAISSLAFATSVFALPRITQQPSPASSLASIGGSLTNRIAATTTNPPLVYQWKFDGVDLPDATNATLVLTNIQPAHAGVYVCAAADFSGAITSASWVVNVDPLFTKIINDPSASFGNSSGIAWGDYNNDGLVDLFVSPVNRASLLFSNNGSGGFTRVLAGSVTTDSGQTFGTCWADYDNDGWLDLFVGVNSQGHDWLYHNNGNGSFAKIVSGAIVNSRGNANNCAWSDYDNDGFVDLFVANSDQNDFLFHNNGDGTFARITTNAIALKAGNSQGGSWGDYDDDGLPDLFVSRVNEANLLYHNQGGGTFVAITNDAIVRDVSAGQGTSWGDFNNDGHLDMFVANPLSGAKNFLYRNNGNGSFTKITNAPVAVDSSASSSGAWGDYDNDGFLDLFVANRSGFDFLYHNNGDGTFTRVTNSVLARDPAVSFSAAWADYDNNGFLDLFVSRFQTYNNSLYRNRGNSNAWIILKCEGRLSNRAAIGAKVRLKAVIAGRETWQFREISGGGGLGAQPDLRPHFGLGDATNVELIRIEWPSGLVQVFTNIAVRQFLTAIEPEARIVPASQQLPAGSTATLTLTTTLAPPLHFQWRFNGIAVPGETNTALVIANVQAGDLGKYSVLVTNPETDFSFATPAAILSGAAGITQQPLSQSIFPGSNLTLRVVASGLGPLSYRWQFNGADLPGASNNTLVLTNVQLAHDGVYAVFVSNSYGTVVSSNAVVTVLIKPVIMLQPLSQTVVSGGSVTFSVSVDGNPLIFGYRWRKNGIMMTNIILNGRTCYFTVTNVQPVGTNTVVPYGVVVTNSAGVSFSTNALLTILTDSDGDGLPDDWEMAAGLDVANSADAAFDADSDGSINLHEYLAGTDPNDARNSLRIERMGSSSGMSFEFVAISNRTYTLQSCPVIRGGVWSRMEDFPAFPTNRSVVLNVSPGPTLDSQRFYRLVTPRVP